jgi:hypothetical protein
MARPIDSTWESTAYRRPGAWRFFFSALALLYIAVALIGFLPNLLRYSAGQLELSRAALAHGALMLGWLSLMFSQASLPAFGRLVAHRRLGVAVAWFAVAIWLSMIAVSINQIARLRPPEGHNLLNILLLQIQAALLFPLFLGWAVAARRRPNWHRRLIVFAMFVPLGAAVDRMQWLPVGGIEGQWPWFLYLDLLLVPLWLFDYLSLRRPHPATLQGTVIVLATQLVVGTLWDNPGWHKLVHQLFTNT